MDSSRSLKDFVQSVGRPRGPDLPDRAGRNLLVAQTIDYDATTGDTVAAGPLELAFEVNDPMSAGSKGPPAPAKVTAKKAARFLPASNRVIFEGGSVCEMVSSDPNGTQQHTLAAPTITVEVAAPGAASSDGLAADMRHLTADGGGVSLSSIDKVDEKVLGGVELKCRQFDFDANEQMFLATGPGLIKLYNSIAAETDSAPGKFSLRKPCWAIIEDFNTLRFFLNTNRLVADGAPDKPLVINYFPIVDGQVRDDRQTVATAAHVEAGFTETSNREFELSTLLATGGVTYKDRDRQFEGDRLFYDAEKSLVTVLGTPGRPCSFNGAPVDAIQWNLKTDSIKFKITAPAALPLK
jgi:hypothetical protein